MLSGYYMVHGQQLSWRLMSKVRERHACVTRSLNACMHDQMTVLVNRPFSIKF